MKNLNYLLKYSFLLSIMVLFSSYSSYSQTNSLLWKVTGDNLEKPIYLYGTLHALPQDDFITYKRVIETLSASNLVVFEVDLLQPDLVQRARERMMMNDMSLEQLLEPKDFETLKRFVEDSLSLPMEALSKVKPLMFSSFFVPKLIGAQPASYDFFFLQKAQALSIEITGIETLDEQFDHFDSVPLADQAQMLMKSVLNFNHQREIYQKMIELYNQQDIEGIYNITVGMSADYPSFKENVLDQRNIKWIPRIIDLCSTRSCFIAVGASHFAGKNGVLDLLIDEGYVVEPIELTLLQD